MKKPQPNKQQLNRSTEITALLGINGTGKTTLVKNMIALMKNRRTLVVQYAGLESAWDDVPVIDLKSDEILTFTGVRQIYFSRYGAESWDLLFKRYHNGNLIFDDCKNYIDPRVEGPLLRLLINRRQLMIDIFAMVHSFKQLPVKFFDYCTEYFLFKTLSSPKYIKDNLDYNYEEVYNTWKRVNEIAGTDTSKDCFHYFEHIKL